MTSPSPDFAEARERMWARTDFADTGCWLFTGCLNRGGYGQIMFRRQSYLAHRLTYLAWVGSVPEDLHLDHLCRVRHCVNPAHLEPVTPAENTRRAVRPPRTHCRRGHAYDDSNTLWSRGGRQCKACLLNRSLARTGGRPPNGRKASCPQGHAYDDANTYRYAGRRYCRACHRERAAAERAVA